MDEPRKVPDELFFMFTARFFEVSGHHMMSRLAWAATNGVKRVHLLIQSTGGVPGDGIGIFNFIKQAPFEVITYNGGTIASIATIVFLAGRRRIANAHSTFMIHKAHFSPQPASRADELESIAHSLRIDDARIEAILKAETRIPKEKWELHKNHDVFFSAQEALEWGVVHEIGDFKPDEDRLINVFTPPVQ